MSYITSVVVVVIVVVIVFEWRRHLCTWNSGAEIPAETLFYFLLLMLFNIVQVSPYISHKMGLSNPSHKQFILNHIRALILSLFQHRMHTLVPWICRQRDHNHAAHDVTISFPSSQNTLKWHVSWWEFDQVKTWCRKVLFCKVCFCSARFNPHFCSTLSY